jgi:hypothetical protein
MTRSNHSKTAFKQPQSGNGCSNHKKKLFSLRQKKQPLLPPTHHGSRHPRKKTKKIEKKGTVDLGGSTA